MGSFLDKLGVHDFLNLIGSGAVFWGGMHFIGIIKLKNIFENIGVGNGVLDMTLFFGCVLYYGGNPTAIRSCNMQETLQRTTRG